MPYIIWVIEIHMASNFLSKLTYWCVLDYHLVILANCKHVIPLSSSSPDSPVAALGYLLTLNDACWVRRSKYRQMEGKISTNRMNLDILTQA